MIAMQVYTFSMVKNIKIQSSFFIQYFFGCEYFKAATPLPINSVAAGHAGSPVVTKSSDFSENT